MNDSHGDVVDLRSRTGYQPDMAGLARSHFARARDQLGMSFAELADALAPLLPEQSITSAIVERWETTAVPPGDVLVAIGVLARTAPIAVGPEGGPDLMSQVFGQRYADVAAIFTTRAEFNAQLPPADLFGSASRIEVAGLSLNSLAQQIADDQLRDVIEGGAHLHCLFLAPGGEAMAAREREELYPTGHLSTLTEMNIRIITDRVRDRLNPESQLRMRVGTYDETVRFNITLVDRQLAIVQPYLPSHRGVESPTFVVRRSDDRPGLFPLFVGIFDKLADRSTER